MDSAKMFESKNSRTFECLIKLDSESSYEVEVFQAQKCSEMDI